MDFSKFAVNADTSTIASGVFLFFLFFAAVMTVVMLWHWKRYGFKAKGIILAEVVYLTGLAILLGGAFFELKFLIS